MLLNKQGILLGRQSVGFIQSKFFIWMPVCSFYCSHCFSSNSYSSNLMFYTVCCAPISFVVLNRWVTLLQRLLVCLILNNGMGRLPMEYTRKGWLQAIHDSRLGVFLLLSLFVHNHHMLSHILYSLHLFLCCYLIDGNIVGETIGLFDPPVLSLPTISSSQPSQTDTHQRLQDCCCYWFLLIIACQLTIYMNRT